MNWGNSGHLLREAGYIKSEILDFKEEINHLENEELITISKN